MAQQDDLTVKVSRRQLFFWLTSLSAEAAQAQQEKVQINPLISPQKLSFQYQITDAFQKLVDHATVIRPDDLAVVQFRWQGLTRSGESLVAGQGGLLIALLPGQHVQEEAILQNNSGVQAKPRPMKARLAEGTRLVFRVPAGASIPYTTEGLLAACQKYPLVVPSQHGVDPTNTESRIIFPTDLVLAPTEAAGFEVPSKPKTDTDGWTELWRVRLEARGPIKIGEQKALGLRAIYALSGPTFPLESVTPQNRSDLVQSMANGSSAAIEEFSLSALGAWAKLHYTGGTPIESWQHRTAMGRDYYVKIVTKGFLFPFGHRAVLTQITERRFVNEPGTQASVAYLVKRRFIVVREPVKNYNDRALPFRSVRFLRLETPLLDNESASLFWPRVDNEDFRFPLEATDWIGEKVAFESPLAFVPVTYTGPLPSNDPRLHREFQGQNIAIAAPSNPSKPGDTSFLVKALAFTATGTGINFLPQLKQATLRVPALENLTGAAEEVQVSYHQKYLDSAFAAADNPAEALLTLTKKSGLNLPQGLSGGITVPDFDFDALSRKLGPITGKAILGGSFDPTQYFSTLKILGGIKLTDILGAGNLDDVPQLVTQSANDALEKTHKLHWETGKFSDKEVLAGLIAFSTRGKKTRLNLDIVSSVKAAGSGSPQSLSISLTQFSILLMKAVEIAFDKLEFKSEGGKKPDVIADVDVKFIGPLSFMNALEPFIPKGGFSDPPSLDVSPSGITAGYTLDLPPVSVGVFNLTNMSLGATLTLPFFGDPLRVRFAFCERHRPFTLAVAIFGGGGFLAIEATTKGLELLEGALEFGGVLAINLGVASGSVSVMAGLYFKIEFKDGSNQVTFAGYLRANGSLRILGMITISAEIYLGLEYANGVMAGEARVSVEIEFLFFSKTVSFSFHKEFAGSSAEWLPDAGVQVAALGSFAPQPPRRRRSLPPVRVEQVVTQADWSAYCAAFA